MLVVSSSIVEVVDKGTNIENKETCDFLSHLIKPVKWVKIYLTQTSIFKKVGVLKENLEFALFKLPLNNEKKGNRKIRWKVTDCLIKRKNTLKITLEKYSTRIFKWSKCSILFKCIWIYIWNYILKSFNVARSKKPTLFTKRSLF